MPVPAIVADMVLVPVAVELRLPVATPLALVGPAGWVSVLLVPVAVRTTVTPGTAFPDASRAVTVMVEVLAPLLAGIVAGAALTVDCPAFTTAGVTVTATVWVI